jgi:hypothetical protein
MNRRDALAALVALPEIARISTAPVGDVIVVECAMEISDDAVSQITKTMVAVWPGRKVVVLSKGLTLKVVSP